MEIDIDINNFRCFVQQLLNLLQTESEVIVIEEFLKLRHYTEENIRSMLSFLSAKLLDPAYTEAIASTFEQYLLLILTTALCSEGDIDEHNFGDYQRKCVALAKLIRTSPDARCFATRYFHRKPAPFQCPAVLDGKPTIKKSKTINENHPDLLVLLKCCYHLLYSDPSFFKELWNWSTFIEQYWEECKNKDLKGLYYNQIIAILTNMTATQLSKLNKNMPPEVLLQFDAEKCDRLHVVSDMTLEIPMSPTVGEMKLLTFPIESYMITNVEGVLLPVFNKDNYKFYGQTDGAYDKIVKVDSTKVNLRSIALGVAASKAICLSGPVGCGKTTLVEYLARKTGRIFPKANEFTEQNQTGKENQFNCKVNGESKPKGFCLGSKRKSDMDSKTLEQSLDLGQLQLQSNGFLRIQLGDQTDSKMLLGQYRCTDVPGEFIWLPGVLTQAVMNGYWLLLEDLDSATQDTYTILSELLENNFLSVPGFRDCVKIEPGFQLFVTVRTNKTSSSSAQKSLYSLLEKYLYTINILPLSRNELCKVISTNYPKLSTVSNRIVDVFLTFSSGDHTSADNLRQQETSDKADTTEKYLALPFEKVSLSCIPNSGRLVSTRDLIKLCERSNPVFSVTSAECAYFIFQNAVDVFCSYLPQGKEKTKLIVSIGAKLGIIQSRCEHFANEYRPEILVDAERIKVGRAELFAKSLVAHTYVVEERTKPQAFKKQKLSIHTERPIMAAAATKKSPTTFSFTRMASCILERISVCVTHAEPVLLVGETGVGKTSSVQYLAERTQHKLVVVNMNNQSDVSDLVGGFKPVDLTYVVAPLRSEFELLFRETFNQMKNESFLSKFGICYNQGNFSVLIKLMLKVVNSVFEKSDRDELRQKEQLLLPRWELLKVKLIKLNSQLSKSINISFAFIPGSLVNCIKNGDWVLLDEINLASAETLECLSTILEPDGSVVLLEKGDFTPVKRHPDFRIFACMNPNTDIGKKDLSVGIRNRFTEFFVDELTTDADLSLLISDYLSNTGIQKKSVTNIVKLYKKLKELSRLELNDGLGNRPVYSLRTLCRSLRICAKNLCGSIERNLYESFCMSFLTQLDPASHNVVLQLVREAMLSNAKAVLKQAIPKPGEDYLNFEGYWIQQGPKHVLECASYILTDSVKGNLKDLARIISIGKLPVLLQGPTSAGKTSLIEYVAKRSGNHCLRINNHEHTDLQEYIGTYMADVTGKLSFREGVLVQAMRNGYWMILDELNLASTDILEALNRVLDDNRELFIPETQTVVKAHANFMLFATQNPPGLYGGRKTLSRAFKNRFIELHFSEIPRPELEIILEKRCLIPGSYAKKMVMCMSDLQKNRKSTSKNVFTLRDLFRWGNRYTFADKRLLEDSKYDWNQHLIEEGYLVLSAKVRTATEIDVIEETLYRNFRKRVHLGHLFDAQADQDSSPVTRDIIQSVMAYKQRADIVWTRNMTRMAVLTAKALQFDEPVLLVGPTGCGKTTVCQILASIRGVQLRILNCHMHTEGADFLGGLRPCRQNPEDRDATTKKLFEWADGPLIHAMLEGSYFMADEISLAEDSVLERLNCVLEPERTVLLAEKGGVADEADEMCKEFVVHAKAGFQFLATMNPGGDFGKKELSPALRNRFTEIWCLPSDSKEDLIQIANNCILENLNASISKAETLKIAIYLVEIVLYIRDTVDKFKFSVRDILAWAHYMATNESLSFPEKAIFGLETIFLDALEMLPHESLEQVELLKADITEFAIKQAEKLLNKPFALADLEAKRGDEVLLNNRTFGIKPFYIPTNPAATVSPNANFLFEAPTTKKNLFRLLSALSLQKPVLLEGPPGVGKTSIVESIAHAIGYNIVRINLCEHTDLADLFGTDLPTEDNDLAQQHANDTTQSRNSAHVGTFVWRDGPLLAALKAETTWILLDELNLAPQSVLEGLNAILDHRGEVYIPELNKSFQLSRETRIFACQNPLKQGGGRKGLPQSFLNRFNKVYLRKLTTADLLYVVNSKYESHFKELGSRFVAMLADFDLTGEHNLFDVYRRWQIIQPHLGAHNGWSSLAFDLSNRLVKFSEMLDAGIAGMEFGYKGGPYEINLRDILRWCDLLVSPQTGFIFDMSQSNASRQFRDNFERLLLTLYERMKLVYYQRMRDEQDKLFIRNAFATAFCCDAEQLNALSEDVALYWTDSKIYLNDIVLSREAPDTKALPAFRSKEIAPFLLSSQREILKNVAECVQMEKPVLLCGAADTGKSKIIHALCTLSNQVCHTDTIDDSVTGSFQQIDLNRHLEQISQQVEGILIAYMQAASFESNTAKTVAEFLNVWSAYNILTKNKTEFNHVGAMSEELILFRKRIQNLDVVIEKLLDAAHTSFEHELAEQRRLLKQLLAHICNAESLNTGGSFEWVDSKIVKSLKCGQYMLLEHVNLCSSAVLDRLNPVFEPSGNLLISEKGVSANESAEIVEKAPNFRVFLTIDPRYGELSRAMRNRCVELALVKDAFNVDDLRSIIHAQGVHAIEAITCVLQIHERACHLTEIHFYNVSHLTQFSFLVASYKRIGYNMERAIYVSAMEVYVYSCNTDYLGYGLDFYQNKLREIVLEETKKFGKNPRRNCPAIQLSNVILSSVDLSVMTLIKLQMTPLELLLQHKDGAQHFLTGLFEGFASINFSDVPHNQLVKFFIYILFECSSLHDVGLRYCYLRKLLDAHPQLQELSHSFHKRIQTYLPQATNQTPAELPWNTKLFPRIRDYAACTLSSTVCQVYCLSASLIVDLLLDPIPQENVLKLSHMNALAYSQAVASNSITDKLSNGFLTHLATFLAHLHQVFDCALKSAQFDLDSFSKFITAVLWANRLLATSRGKLFIGKSLNTELVHKLLLHFKWLNKNLLQLLESVQPNYLQLYANFEHSLQKLTNFVLSAKPPLNLIRKIYAKQMTQFQPFYQEEQIKLNSLTQKVDQLLSVVPNYGCFTPQQILKKFLAQRLDSSKRARAIINRAADNRFNYKFKEFSLLESGDENLPAELKIALLKFASELKELDDVPSNDDNSDLDILAEDVVLIQHTVNSLQDLTDSSKPKDIELRMLSLREYYLTKALTHIVIAPASTGQLKNINVDFAEATASLSCATWQLINLLQTPKYKYFSGLWLMLTKHVDGLQELPEFERLFVCLNGSYRNLSTYWRLICNALRNQQLSNLALRYNCTNILRSNEEVDCRYVYGGPSLMNALSSIIFQADGGLKPVALNDLVVWRESLQEMRQLVWHNSQLMTPTYAITLSDFKSILQSAKRLLYEVDHVKGLCESVENESFTDYNAGFQKLTHSLSTALTQVKETLQNDVQLPHPSLKEQQMQCHAAYMTALVGAIELCLLTFTPLIDPVEKNRLKNLYIAEDISCLSTLTTVYDFMRVIMKYKRFGAEVYKVLEDRLLFLTEKQQQFSQKVAIRPDKCLYSSLVQDITHFLRTNCEPQSLHNLIVSAQLAYTSLSGECTEPTAKQGLEICSEAMNKIELWVANSQRFVNHTLKPYTDCYQDFLQPLQCSVDQLRYGFESLKMILTQMKSAVIPQSLTHAHTNINDGGGLHAVLRNIAEFPSTHTLSIFSVNSSRDILKNRAPIFRVLEKVPGSELDYFRLLKAKLAELRNLVNISADIGQEAFREFDFALNVSNQIWQQEEERRRQQQAEEESLYVNKAKCATEDEELLELQEIEEIFPTNVQEDFGDFLLEDTLEKVMKLDKKKDLKMKCTQVVRDEDYTFLAEHFTSIMVHYSKVYYHKPSAKQAQAQLEIIPAFKQRMRVFIKLCTHYKQSLNDWLADEVYNCFGFAIGLQQHSLNEVSFPCKSTQPYNFYKDTNLPEVIACGDLLDRIEERVDEQLALYSEHASLIDIKRVIERIRALPSTSPVVRFNTGFQILRQKVSQWNEVAHKGNHLRQEEIEVAEYVQKWTKMELQCWRNCLSQTCKKVESHAHKYWFFIYNLIQEFMLDHELDSSYTDIKYAEKRFAEGELLDAADVKKASKVSVGDIVRILRQFVEAACYGDFHVRMQLLQAFELYLHNVARNSAAALDDNKLNELIAGLRNLQIYFAQFSEEVEEANKTIRTPIEKKLKEFVKIESYNKDLSYFSMRNNVVRVHRHLNKFLKQYQQELQQKITPVFQPKDATVKDYNFASDKGKELRYDSKIKYYLMDVKCFVAPQNLRDKFSYGNVEGVAGEQALLHKVGRLFATSRNVVKETVTNAAFPKLIIALDVLLSQQLERCEHLRGLTVDRTKERPKQVLEAKQILQQKRKGLSDLFKVLGQLGLNFKTGLMESSLRSEFEDYALEPFCIKTMLGATKDKRTHASMLHLNEHLDKYYAKCTFKLKLLQNLMLSSLSELGPMNIDRVKGFAVDMFLLVQQQRRQLAGSVKSIYDLRIAIQQLIDIAEISSSTEEPLSQLEFAKSRDTYLALKQSVCSIRYVFEQFNLLLACVPRRQDTEHIVLSETECLLQQSSPTFAGITKNSDQVLQLAKNTLSDMSNADCEFLSAAKLATYRKAHARLVQLVGQIRDAFKVRTSGDHLPISNCLASLLALVGQPIYESVLATKTLPVDFQNIEAELENISHCILLSLQKLYKKHPKVVAHAEDGKSPTKSKDVDGENADESALQEHHLKRRLHGELVADWETLNMPIVITKLSNILLSLKHSPASLEKLGCLRKVTTLLPILEQYHLMADYYLFQQLGAHKVSAKILSVMLTVFVELGTKGFCVPPDLMQDEQGEAKKEQKEGEGFGLEDGTGEKDASDKIESEDQLDDAKRPEDRKDEGDKQEQDDCKEEKGIEMSDDFDGKMQDIEKPENEEDDSGESEDEEDLNKEMGETEEGADKLDDQIWGDDEEEEEEEQELNEEENGKGSKDEEDSHNDLNAKNDAAQNKDQDEHDKDGLDATNDFDKNENRKKQEKDIDNMKEPEIDEEQVNPYHNELEEPPEPEDMDLGDMNNVDDDHEDGDNEQQGDENPFDIDAMKENMQTPEEQQKDEDIEENIDEKEDGDGSNDSDSEESDGDADVEKKEDKQANGEEQSEDPQMDDPAEAETQKRGDMDEAEPEEKDSQKEEEAEEKREEKPEQYEQSKDKSSKEENVQTIPESENKGSADQVQNEESEKDIKQDQKLDEQETGEEKDGVGQAENENTNEGHQGIAETKDTTSQDDQKQEKQNREKRKQGGTDEERTLGEAKQNELKQLKTIDKLKQENQNEDDDDDIAEKEDEGESEEYQHIKEPKSADKITLDNATEEQSKKIQHNEDDVEEQDKDGVPEGDGHDDLMDVEEDEAVPEKTVDEDLVEMPAEKFNEQSEKPSKSDKTKERAEAQQEVQVEGEIVPTMNVPRSTDTTAHCIKEILLDNLAQTQELSTAESLELRKMYQQQLITNKTALPEHEDFETWQSISHRMAQNARELCEQLRLILEPTKCTRLKGDYRTGRRINMKKIIPYIASQFRKDKIWLRRTKPAQRDYKITIAIDDSKSMHHNNSKTLTLEAISLVSQALTLLESGRLSIVSFGESPQIILNHTQQFDGPKLVQSLNFAQNKTKIAELLDFTRTASIEESAAGSENSLFENLLLVLSDGRNIFSEGKAKVKNAVKLARLQRIFLVYIIIDNPANKNSILDIQTMEILPDKSINIKSYLDDFPFPYYVIVRDLNQLPIVLSEAMRQWFELVNSEQ